MQPLELLFLLVWELEEHNQSWALPRWHLLLLENAEKQHKERGSTDVTSRALPTSQLQAESDLPGGCCVVGRQSNQQEERFCISIQFPSLWKSNQCSFSVFYHFSFFHWQNRQWRRWEDSKKFELKYISIIPYFQTACLRKRIPSTSKTDGSHLQTFNISGKRGRGMGSQEQDLSVSYC